MSHIRKSATAEDVIWEGRVYRRDVGHNSRHRRVYFMATTEPRTYLHRDVYANAHGPIPDGWHVHHIDGNPLNNSADNLASMASRLHAQHHAEALPSKRVACNKCSAVFEAVHGRAKWCSQACKEKHRRDIGVAYVRPHKPTFSKPCAVCATEFVVKRPWAAFCSSRCKSALQRERQA